MNVLNLGFPVFLAVFLLLYYLLPAKLQPHVLLLASLIFLWAGNPWGLIFVGLSALVIYLAGRWLSRLDSLSGGGVQKKKRAVLTGAVLFHLVILAVLKYAGAYLGAYLHRENPFGFLIPLGLSYYTLQAIGYVLDVYWGKIPAASSFGKLLLFVCYFPQMLQGPISRYQDLSRQLYGQPRRFSLTRLLRGLQLMLWGYLKVSVMGSRFGNEVTHAFYNGQTAYGLTVLLGFIFWGFQLYCNFSGGIDLIRGASQCFGVELPDNFRQPFFSRSLGEFWRRWHITLGSWMKDYVFFPFSMSKSTGKFKKFLKKHVSRKMANRIPIAVGNIVVFLLVGIWHGTGTNFALWGLYNGVILAFSELMTEPFRKAKSALHINEKSRLWSGFCLVRTFLVVTLGWCTDCADSALGALRLVKNMCLVGRTNLQLLSTSVPDMAVLVLMGLLLLAVDLIHEKGICIREALEEKPMILRILVWTAAVLAVVIFVKSGNGGGLMYADF